MVDNTKSQSNMEPEFYRKKGIRLMEDADETQILTKPGPFETWRGFVEYYHMFDKAHLVMLYEEGIVSKDNAIEMLKKLGEMEEIGIEKVRRETGQGMYSGEYYLIQKLGEEVGGNLHIGRSTGDLSTVSGRLRLRNNLLEIMSAIIDYANALLKLAEENLETLMPTYTNMQQAQVGTLAHYLLQWVYALTSDFQRFMELYGRVNRSPAGAAIGTGSDFHLNRERTAELLGFDSAIENTMYAMTKDYIFEAYTTMILAMIPILKFEEDLFIWQSNEYGMIEFADRYCGTSSLMPQKKNPHAPFYINGCITRLYGHFMGELMNVSSLAGFGAGEIWKSVDEIKMVIRTMTGICSSLKINKSLMEKRIGDFWAIATDIAALLVREKEISWRAAHQIVAILVRKAEERGISGRDLKSEMVDEAALEYIGKKMELGDEIIKETLDPIGRVKSRTLLGGPAPQNVKKSIEELGKTFEKNRKLVIERQKKLGIADQKFRKAVESILHCGQES